MKNQELISIISIVLILVVAALVSVAVNPGSVRFADWPVFGICACVTFAMQWIIFTPAYLLRSEAFFDIAGSITFLSVIGCALLLSEAIDPRAALIAILVAIWAVRLGTFLSLRVKADGFDRRFNQIKRSFPRFLMAWTLQGLWVFMSIAAGLAAMTAVTKVPLDGFALAGGILWLIGFTIEVVADDQKRKFRQDPEKAGKFISTGIWAWSRHPNYFGEIILWLGITVIAIPTLTGWQWVTLISPIFIILLLTKISGIPMLEARAKKIWGDNEDYRNYKASTPVLLLWPPK